MTDLEIISYVISRKTYNTVKNVFLSLGGAAGTQTNTLQTHDASRGFSRYVIAAASGNYNVRIPVVLGSTGSIFPLSVTIFDGNAGSETLSVNIYNGVSSKQVLTITGNNTTIDRCLERTVEDFYIE